MSWAHSPATATELSGAPVGRSEYPKPGMSGTTTSNASAGSAPCAPGSVSSETTLEYRQNESGQPWQRTRGSTGPAGATARACTKWIP